MEKIIKRYYLIFPLCFISLLAQAQPTWFPTPLSTRIASYDIAVRLDTAAHRLHATQTVFWKNPSADTIYTMPFHLYFNAFKNTESTFYQESKYTDRYPDVENIQAGDFGWSRIDKIGRTNGADLTDQLHYIQPDDDNQHDRTVVEVVLDQPVLPHDSIQLQLEWTAQIPKVRIRTGYSKDFYIMAQWFPKLGVYEPTGMRFSKNGQWNCHQYHRMTEYYADFGVYNVAITVPKDYVVGATGVHFKQHDNTDGTDTHFFHGEDIIDFTWAASPDLQVIEETYKGIDIRLLIIPEYTCCTDRYLSSAKHAIDYLGELFMPYPFPNLTICVTPFHAVNAGAMEYPTFITVPGLYKFPRWLRTPEYFVVHEFVHQYFMMMVATNEFEEAWMDEGFTSYFKSRILDHAYGKQSSVIDLPWLRMGAMEFFRGRYTGMDDIHYAESSRFGWEYPDGSPRALFYSKPATWLKTLEGIVGIATMDDIMTTYFDRWKFNHPCRYDFIEVVNEVVQKNHGDTFGNNLNWFFDYVLYGTGAVDYAVGSISNNLNKNKQAGFFDDSLLVKKIDVSKKYESKVVIERLAEIQLPIDILVHFDDGTEKTYTWNGRARTHGITVATDSKIDFVKIDPDMKIYMDTNILNNSLRTKPETATIRSYMAGWMVRVQQVLQSVGFLV